MSDALSSADRETLVELARATVAARLRHRPPPRIEDPGDALTRPCGAFVTLKVDGRLRGCIGHLTSVQPLWRTVRDTAAAAAFEDPRFPPVASDELEAIRFEVSVLSPFTEVDRPGDIVVGVHGLLVERGPIRGLLLPQVAVEHRMDRETFLDQTCRKAGLPRGCWRDSDVVVRVFTAEVFGEER